MTEQVFEGLAICVEDDEPWVLDEDLAKSLGYQRVRDIRKLIARHMPFLPGIRVRATVARTQMPTGGTRNTDVAQYALNESHALYIAAKSNTLQANQLLQKVVAAFIAAKKFIRSLVTSSLERATQELEELRKMYREDIERLTAPGHAASMALVVPPPGQRTMVTITNHIDTSDGKKLYQVQAMFGLPRRGKNAHLVRLTAQAMGIYDNPMYMYNVQVDTRGGDTFSRPSRKYKPAAIEKMAHTLIKKARDLNCNIPENTLQRFGDPGVPLQDSPPRRYDSQGRPIVGNVVPLWKKSSS